MVKNVTGYDLCKVLAGSFGTLAAMTEVTIKTLPRAETEATVLVLGLDDARANAAMSAAMGSSCDVSGAAHLPRNTVDALRRSLRNASGDRVPLEGVAPSVRHRKDALTALLQAVRPAGSRSPRRDSRKLWRSVRDAAPFWRTARRRPAAVARLDHARARRSEFAAHAAARRAVVLRLGRRADLDRAAALRRRRRRHDPPRRGGDSAATPRCARAGRRCAPRSMCSSRSRSVLAALTKRVKESFDPKGVLNPGRMWAGV